MLNFPLVPEQAATSASKMDLLFFALIGVSAFFIILIFVLIVIFSIRYRRGREIDRVIRRTDFMKLEIAWIVIPTLISLVIFGWSAWLYFVDKTPPADATEIYVVGKQWMWKIQHQNGNREINELHVPTGKPVKLIMTSEDVIHSFFIPAFRIKQDVLPGRYTTEWFTPTKAGEYHLFCAEYCGTNHSAMIGKVVVMDPMDFQHWLATSGTIESMASLGEQVFKEYGCAACHRSEDSDRGPMLSGLAGSIVSLQNGGTVVADKEYLRESINDPGAKIVAGYKPIMPAYKTTLSQEQINQLVEYLLTLPQGRGSGVRSAK